MKKIPKLLKTLFLLFLLFSFTFNSFLFANRPSQPTEFALFEEVPKVFSASKIEEPLLEAPAAISVITGDQLEEWGIVDLPDAFRFIPGMDVTAFDGREWGVTARGFNERLADKMLVLIDGMSVYTPLFSGVIWSALPLLIEDIDRIEVTRGPNDTLYGFNAFNGVINIVTKEVKDTQGPFGKYTYGSHQRQQFIARYGDTVDFSETKNLGFRTAYSFHQTEGYGDNNGEEWTDSRHLHLSTGRAKYVYNERLNFETLYGVSTGPNATASFSPTNPNFKRYEDMNYQIGRLNFVQNDHHHGSLQLYHWWLDRDAKILSSGLSTSDHEEEQFDVEFEDHLSFLDNRSQTVWGASYRMNLVRSLLVNRELPTNSLRPQRDDLYSFFFNEKFMLLEDRRYLDKLFTVFGLRAEGSGLIEGPRWAPRASLLYGPVEDHILRVTYARAYRLPNYIEEFSTILVPANTGTITRVLGNGKMKPEEVDSFEAGLSSVFWNGKMTFDADAFVAHYSGIATTTQTRSGALSITSFNSSRTAWSEGVELATTVQPHKNVSLFANYTYEYVSDSLDLSSDSSNEGVTPRNKAAWGVNYRFYKDTVPSAPYLEGLSLNLNMNYTDSHIVYSDTSTSYRIKHHIRTDLRIAKSFYENALELAFIAQNLTSRYHYEAGFVQVPQLFFLTLTLRSWPWDIWKEETERTKGFMDHYQSSKKSSL